MTDFTTKLRAIPKKARSVITMGGIEYDGLWMCDGCIESLAKDPEAKLCKKCYETGKANADFLIRANWAWDYDLEPHADEIKQDFLRYLEDIKPEAD